MSCEMHKEIYKDITFSNVISFCTYDELVDSFC